MDVKNNRGAKICVAVVLLIVGCSFVFSSYHTERVIFQQYQSTLEKCNRMDRDLRAMIVNRCTEAETRVNIGLTVATIENVKNHIVVSARNWAVWITALMFAGWLGATAVHRITGINGPYHPKTNYHMIPPGTASYCNRPNTLSLPGSIVEVSEDGDHYVTTSSESSAILGATSHSNNSV